MKIVNPFERNGRWYKANLHCHSTTSDGECTVEQLVQRYREKDYRILAITDHDQTNDVEGLSTEELLVVSGMETHPSCPGHYEPYHLICLNVRHGFEIPPDADVNARIALVKSAGGEAVLSHPYWSGLDINHLLAVQGNMAVEVFNATCSRFGKAFSSVHWDNLLNKGRMIPAIAVDDTHRGGDTFMGWTMIRAEELSVPAMLEALRTGCYYSSCGPVIEDLRVTDGEVQLSCSPVAEVHFVCSSWRGRSMYADEGDDLTGAEFALKDRADFVRVELVDRKGRRAWTNPLAVR